jgi:cytoskeleton protein RodZ
VKEPGENHFGEELRRERLVREVSLESIAAATKISTRHLQALERGDVSKLPAPVFTRGFIRAYAIYLGLNPEEMINAYLSDVGAPLPASRESAMATPTPRLRGPGRIGGALVLASVVVGLLLVAYFHRRPVVPPRRTAGASEAPPTPPNVVMMPPSTLPAPSAGSATAAVPPASPASASTAKSAAAALPLAPGTALNLSLSFARDCWVQVFADDQSQFSGLLHAGDTRQFSAGRELRLTIGDASAVRVSINGHPVPTLGGPGQVLRDLRFDAAHPEGYRRSG